MHNCFNYLNCYLKIELHRGMSLERDCALYKSDEFIFLHTEEKQQYAQFKRYGDNVM